MKAKKIVGMPLVGILRWHGTHKGCPYVGIREVPHA